MRDSDTMLSNHSYQGILFDFDGVLSQSMDDNFKAWQATAAEYGITIKGEDYFPLEGMPVKDVVVNLFQLYGKSISDVEKVARLKDDFYLKFNQFKLYPGVTTLIDILVDNRIPIGIVTGAQKARILATVPKVFIEKFNALVTGDMTLKGKPFPDPYLLGSELLGIPPEHCIVVENAPLGIQAAKTCKTYCIAICSTLESSFLQEANLIVESFEQLLNLDVINVLLENSQN